METYHAGGLDTVAKTIIQNINYTEVELFINKNHDDRIINIKELNKKVTIKTYSLLGTSEVSNLAYTYKNRYIRFFLRLVNILIKYPLIIFSILYFYMKFRNIKADIFISINGGYPAGEYCRSSLLAMSPFCNNLFMVYFNKPAKSKKIFSIIENLYDGFLDKHVKFICDSKANSGNLNKYRNIKQEVTTIHNGLMSKRQKRYSKKSSIFNILNIANFEDRKNQMMLINVVDKLIKENYLNIKLVLIGASLEFEYKNKIKSKIESLKLDKYIEIIDYTNNLEQYYRDADIFVLSSKGESLPVVVSESLSYGLPVIATDVGGLREQITDSFNGYIIKPNDIDEMVRKIIFLINNPDNIEILGNNAYTFFESEFTIDSMLQQYNKIFKDNN